MIDVDAAIRVELERLVPVTAERDWEAVARAAGLGGRRRRRVLVVALAALVLAGGAVAAVREAPWWQSGAPPVDPKAVASVARDNLPAHVDTARARTVAQDGNAALVAVPLSATGYCLIPALDGRADLGSQCVYKVTHPEQDEGDWTLTVAHPASDGSPAAWLVYGRIADPRAAKLDLGPLDVRLVSGGFFLAQVPRDRWSGLDGSANPGRVLDASGRTLRSGCVSWGPSPLSKQAGVTGLRLFESGGGACKPRPVPVEPTVDLSRARKLVELTLLHDFSIWKAGTAIALWRAPAKDGACVWLAPVAPAPSGTSHGVPSAGGCGDGMAREPVRPLIISSVDVGGAGLVVGRVRADSGIDRVVLASASGRVELPLANGWFVGQLPEGSPPGKLPPGGPFVLVGYDAGGKQVARASIEALVKAATPH